MNLRARKGKQSLRLSLATIVDEEVAAFEIHLNIPTHPHRHTHTISHTHTSPTTLTLTIHTLPDTLHCSPVEKFWERGDAGDAGDTGGGSVWWADRNID